MKNKPETLAGLILMTCTILSCSSLPFSLQKNASQELAQPVIETVIVVVTAESTTAPSQPVISNQKCNNIFYPMLPENQWVYEFKGQEETSQIGMSVSELDSGEIAVNMLGLETGVTSQTQIECENETIVNFPLLSLGFLMGDALDGSIETDRVSGIFMPNEAEFVQSNWATQWQGEYIARGNMFIKYDGEEVKVLLEDSPIRLNWSIPDQNQVGKETITVKAGTYEGATRLHRTIEMDASVNMDSDGNTFTVDGTIILEQTLWYKENIGLLKQQIDEASIKAFGVQYPVTLDGTVELVEFRN